MNEYSIGEVIEITGISRTTILYYETKGLVSPRQEESGYRKYTIDDITKMMFYQSLKTLGISVDECKCQFNNVQKVENNNVQF